MLTDLKKSDDFVFLKVVDSIALQQSLRDLDRGFVNFRKYFPEVEQPEEKTVHTFVYASDTKKRYIHIYYSAAKAVGKCDICQL